jgi:short-subunit dehydrogenase
MTASAMAHLAIPGYALYAGTKAALHRFAEAYRYELPAHGHLMMIYPIATRTRFFNAAGDGTPRSVPSQTADYVAARIMAGLKRDARAVYPSITFVIYNGLCGVFPPLRRIQLSISAGQFRRWGRRNRP